MRKNFTQLFLGLALIVGFSTMGNAQCEIDPPPGAYYNYQFDGGLEGWRALDAAGFETTNGWAWNETADLTQGFYSGNGPTEMASESQCNGAAIMDSDFLDNGGTGNSGAGPCPADCNGYLVSPVMDFSAAETEVDLTFFQSVRQFQSEFYIYKSRDGGVTNFDTIEINQGLVLNAATTQEFRRIPMCGLKGEAEVVITFHYVGNYYYWGLDDVSLEQAETSVDMRVNNNFYTKAANYATPKNMTTTVPILADIENLRAEDSPASVLNFRVRDGVNQEIYSASRDYGPVPGCSTDENKLFDDMFAMPTEEGDYSIEFEMAAPGDANADNDVITAPFKITEREFRKLPTEEDHGSPFVSGFRYGDGLISWGAYFQMPNNDQEQSIESITLGYITSTADPVPSPGFINVAVYQWVDFDDIGTVNPGERLLLGETDIFIEPDFPSEMRFTVDITDVGGNAIVPDPGAELLVVAHTSPFNENTNYFFYGVDDNDFPEYSPSANQLAHREAGMIGGYGGFAAANSASHDDRHDRQLFNVDGGVIWDISMMLSPLTSVEDINEDIAVSIFPSPASEKVNVELSLEEVSKNVSIELTDMAGNRAGTYNFTNIKKDRLTIDVSEMPGGMYLMNIRTEAGMISKKISVVK